MTDDANAEGVSLDLAIEAARTAAYEFVEQFGPEDLIELGLGAVIRAAAPIIAARADIPGFVSSVDAIVADLADKLDQARAERDEARAEAARQRGRHEKSQRRVEELWAERDAMRPVVDAARAWREFYQTRGAAYLAAYGVDRELRVAVDAYDTAPKPDTGHRYLSTSCLHGEHGYCQTTATRYDGTTKIAATCKFCAAPCVCDCHQTAPQTAPNSTQADDPGEVVAQDTGDTDGPAWLTEAVEAAARVWYNLNRPKGKDWFATASPAQLGETLAKAAAAVRAAAPIIRRAALNDAADALEESFGHLMEAAPAFAGHQLKWDSAAARLRERAKGGGDV